MNGHLFVIDYKNEDKKGICMNTAKECIRRIESGAYDAAFTRLYGADDVERQCGRYRDMVSAFARQFGEDREVTLFSAPGRTEIGGTHTDHNMNLITITEPPRPK